MILVQYALHCKLNITNITAAELSTVTSKVGGMAKTMGKNTATTSYNARFRYFVDLDTLLNSGVVKDSWLN